MSEFDLVIRGGTVADGTGETLRTADVAVSGGVIAEVGRVSGTGAREIAADGALVAPGWVDVHTHYDGQAVWDPQLAPSSNQGVTTVLFGNCGVGFAPVRPDGHDTLVRLMEGVEDIPGTALHEGLTWEWESFPEYLDALERIPHDVDFAAQVPHGALRVYVMGERGVAGEDATADDIAAMAALAQEGIEAGALGFSTSRTANHRSSDGTPTPSLTATATELGGIAEGLRRAGAGVLQVVSDFTDLDLEWPVVLAMAERSGRPVSMTVAEVFAFNPTPESTSGFDVLDRITAAREAGLELSAQVAPRGIGLTMGLSTTLHPFMACPPWREVADLPAEARVAALRSGDLRERLLASYSGQFTEGALGGSIISRFDLMVRLADPPDYEQPATESVAAIAARTGRTPHEVALDIMLEDDGCGLLYLAASNYRDWTLDSVRAMLTHPYAVPGLSDGGAHVSTICDAGFPTFLLSHWGRRRSRGERLPVEFLVQRHSRATAELVGLHDRGVLAPGYRADVNVIDLDNLQLRRPEMHWDLPAGGRRFIQRADGYLHTFLAGQETYRDGEPTGRQPGRLVRGAQPAPCA
ncbi:MAG TPA: amidohydrolase family protein [Pseudonocardia sp.]|jgi:N-acyl-D-aspartate/D-glutamate deacylase